MNLNRKGLYNGKYWTRSLELSNTDPEKLSFALNDHIIISAKSFHEPSHVWKMETQPTAQRSIARLSAVPYANQV